MNTQHFDVLIIGAGLSGIGTACQVSAEFPHKTIAILERRERLGGTWDLFRYPGIRSDSDMLTFGYKWRPWQERQVLADGPSIRQYIADTAAEYGVDEKIQYGLKIVGADWSSAESRWTVTQLADRWWGFDSANALLLRSEVVMEEDSVRGSTFRYGDLLIWVDANPEDFSQWLHEFDPVFNQVDPFQLRRGHLMKGLRWCARILSLPNR